jgi:hypothetical protein
MILGKITLLGCVHCEDLKTPWDILKNEIKNENKKIKIVEIDAENEEKEISEINKTLNGDELKSEGYPTVFKIVNKKVYYYTGPRSSAEHVKEMKKWLYEDLDKVDSNDNKNTNSVNDEVKPSTFGRINGFFSNMRSNMGSIGNIFKSEPKPTSKSPKKSNGGGSKKKKHMKKHNYKKRHTYKKNNKK